MLKVKLAAGEMYLPWRKSSIYLPYSNSNQVAKNQGDRVATEPDPVAQGLL